MAQRYRPFLFAALTILIASTAVSGPRPYFRKVPPTAPVPNGSPFAATLDEIQANIFDPRCSFCHYEGSDLGNGLWLETADHSFEKLVGIMSPVCTTETRVIPNNADASYIIKKLEGTQACGDQMPLGDQPLDPEVIQVVRDWINNGALRQPPIATELTTWGAIKAVPRKELRPR